jgi:hypothetical protein
LGLTVLAAERLGSPTNDSFALGVGIAQQTASGLRDLAGRFAGRPARAAYRTLDWATKRTSLRANAGPLARRREEVRRLVQLARERGQATVEAGRAEASTFLQANVTDGMAWAEDQAVPQMVDGLVPHLVESVVPQIVDGIVPHLVETVVPQVIDGVMPEIRARVLPVIIDDLTNDPRLRELVLEQSRGVVGEAAQQLRSATATADDRVEQAFRRWSGVNLRRGRAAQASSHGGGRERLRRSSPRLAASGGSGVTSRCWPSRLPVVAWQNIAPGARLARLGLRGGKRIVPWPYFTSFWWLTGQTPGDLATGIVVEHRDGRMSSACRRARRRGLLLASRLIGMFAVLWDSVAAWHDRLRTDVRHSTDTDPDRWALGLAHGGRSWAQARLTVLTFN